MTHAALWHAAAAYAARAHEHQHRRDGRTPYAAHAARVAMIIAARFGVTDEAVLAAAFLHDTIEDCGTDREDIVELCGETVASYVAAMTKDMRLPEPEREAAYDAQLAAGPWQARLIKLADVWDNLTDAADMDDGGTARLLDRARRALRLAEGDAELREASTALRALMESIGAGT
jgi:(p)ppGpp synthase/HD superfamily hydrolase